MPSISVILSVFTAITVGFAVVMVLINLFRAGRKSWIVGVIRVVLTLVAAVLALPLSKLLANTLSDALYNIIAPMITPAFGGTLGDIMEAAPEGLAGVRSVIFMASSLVLYAPVFLLLSIILSIVCAIVCHSVSALRKSDNRAIAMPLGALNGLLIVLVVLAPLCGFLTMGGNILGDVAASVDRCDSPAVSDMLESVDMDSAQLRALSKDLKKQPVISTVYATTGRPIFEALAKDELEVATDEGTEVVQFDLRRETSALACTALHLVDAGDALSNGGGDFTEKDKDRLYNLSESIVKSRWTTLVINHAMTALADNWKNGESFAGIEAPDAGKVAKPAFDSLMDAISTSQPDTLQADLNTLFDVLGDLMAADLLSGSDDYQKLVNNASDTDLFNLVATKLEANSRFQSVGVEIRRMGVRLLSNMLGTQQLQLGEHAELMDKVAAELTDVLAMSKEERHEQLPAFLEQTFGDHGYEVPENITESLADQIIDDLGADGEITADELTAYLTENA